MRSLTGAAQPGMPSPTRSAAYVASALIPSSWANPHPHNYNLQDFPGFVLRLAAHGGGVAPRRLDGEPQAGAAADAGHGSGGDLPEAEHQPGASGAQGLPVSVAGSGDRATEPGLVRRHHVDTVGEFRRVEPKLRSASHAFWRVVFRSTIAPRKTFIAAAVQACCSPVLAKPI